MGPPPPNAYPPGTTLTVGTHTAVIQKYISEGGFAHVYKVDITPPYNGSSIACLKRVAVPDKTYLNILRAEVDAMKRLKGNKHIVSYIDSHAARLNSASEKQAYEVLLLMEYCSRNGLIDFMNTRLTNKLTEPEILQIMGEVTEGVANTHYLSPPLIHRDIKIENVLISGDGTYKLCDFGSASPILRPPRNSDEFTILQQDIMQHTTAQYRSPEMIDLYRGFPIDGKSDIWALGVFLYKLCYYTTPFEREGEIAILRAKFVLPHSPQFSDRLKNVITVCLKEDPRQRPTVYQLLEEICKMRGLPTPNVMPKALSNTSKPKESNGSLKINSSVKPALPKRPATNNGVSVTSSKPQAQPLEVLTLSSSASSNSSEEEKDPFARIEKSRILTKTKSLPKPSSPIKIERPKSQSFQSNMNVNGLTRRFTNLATNSYKSSHTGKVFVSESVQTDADLSKYEKSTGAKYGHSKSVPNLERIDTKRPVSLYWKPTTPTKKDFKSLKTLISGISGQTNTVELSPGDNHIDNNVDFLNYLEQQDSGASWKRQNTGGSQISIRTGSRLNRRSINGMKSLLTGNKESKSLPSSRQPSSTLVESKDGYDGGESLQWVISTPAVPKDVSSKHTRSLSIQRRVHMLLNKSTEKPIVKTARGYGEYTDVNNNSKVEIRTLGKESTNSKSRPPKPISKPIPNPQTPPLSTDVTGLPAVSSVNAKKAPPKPKKPSFLKSPKKVFVERELSHKTIPQHKRQVSTMSEVSMIDIDDLEKDFNQRFPSAV